MPWPGFGPFESYEADHLVAGGERLQLAGFEIDVIFTPGHSPGHVTYSVPDEQVVFSGDVLFQRWSQSKVLHIDCANRQVHVMH